MGYPQTPAGQVDLHLVQRVIGHQLDVGHVLLDIGRMGGAAHADAQPTEIRLRRIKVFRPGQFRALLKRRLFGNSP